MRRVAIKFARSFRIWLILVLALTAIAMPAGAQKKNKKTPPPPDPGQDLQSEMHTPDAQAIDQAIGEALGYWQIA
jgi:hypothetical protein